MSERDPNPGWLLRVLRDNDIEVACWSPSMRKAGNINTKRMHPDDRAEAVRRLRQWADELDAEGGHE